MRKLIVTSLACALSMPLAVSAHPAIAGAVVTKTVVTHVAHAGLSAGRFIRTGGHMWGGHGGDFGHVFHGFGHGHEFFNSQRYRQFRPSFDRDWRPNCGWGCRSGGYFGGNPYGQNYGYDSYYSQRSYGNSYGGNGFNYGFGGGFGYQGGNW